MLVLSPRRCQPRGAAGRVGYGVSDVYLPPSGLISVSSGDVAAMHATLGTYNETPIGLAYGHASGGLYTPSLTLPASGTYASLLMVIGAMPTTNNGSFVVGTSGFGLRANNGIITYRASSASLMATSKAVGAGAVLFTSWRSGEHRIEVAYADGSVEAQVNTASWGNASPVDALQEVGQSIALLARWINWVPPADVRQRLLREPWSLLGDEEIWLWASSSTQAADLAGTAAASATASGSLTTGIPVLGAALGVASGGASLSTGIPMQGVAASISGAGGAVGVDLRVSGAAVAQALSAAAMATGVILTVDAISDAAAQGSLASVIGLIGSTAALSGTIGTLSAGAAGDMASAASASADATAALTINIRLEVSAVASAAAAAALGIGGLLSGSAGSAAGATGALTLSASLSAEAAAAAITAGEVVTRINLDALAASAGAAAVALDGRVLISGQAASIASARAVFAPDVLPVPDPRYLHVARQRRYLHRARRRNYLVRM